MNYQVTGRGSSSRSRKASSVPPKTKTLSDKAYEQIKDRLVSAKYVPGQFLQEAQICADLKLGRTPVHQALHRLQQEGLVEIIPRKGILVKSDSLSEIFLALEVRALVEPYCAALCAEKATQADINALRDLLDEYDAKRESANKSKLMEMDRRLHTMIAEIAGNHLLADFLRPIHERMSRIWFLPHWQFHDFGLTGSEHGALFEAIEKRDAEGASAAMKEHVDSLRRRIMEAGS